jgi:hypothetical protein
MKIIKLLALTAIVAIVMVVGWIVGNMLGNSLTGSLPPPPADVAQTTQWFFIVCIFNSVLITLLVDATRAQSVVSKAMALVLYVFGVQFLLPQMETFFFSSEIGITRDQASAILISGVVVSLLTMTIAVIVHRSLLSVKQPVAMSIRPQWSIVRSWILPLILFGYPLLYMTFGYYVAWQSESLRVFYTGSSLMTTYSHQLGEALTNGIYFFQILRALIWILVTLPVVVMLQGNSVRQYLMVGFLSALLPTSLLFIPNPYMPADVAMTHFVETATSNFVWGLLMVFGLKKGFAL